MLNSKQCYIENKNDKKENGELTICSSLIRQLDRCEASPSIHHDLVLHHVFLQDEDEVKHS